MPILGLPSSSRNILSEGTVIYPESQLGVFDVRRGLAVPEGTVWATVLSPAYGDPELLENPGFEFGTLGWSIATPADTIPMTVDIRPGIVGNAAVLTSNELGYKGGLGQPRFLNVPPNTTFRYSAWIKTVNVEDLKVRALHYGVYLGGAWAYEGMAELIVGSRDWALYEVEFTTPDEISDVTFFASLVYNRGEVWIDEASAVATNYEYAPQNVILNWHRLHNTSELFVTAEDLNYVEEGFRSVPAENFWGIIFIAEEHYRHHIRFNDDVNTTWFNERLLGYPLYLAESPDATIDQWKDEMFLRMIRGFYNYFHPLTKVGITANGGSTVDWWKDNWAIRGIPYYWGDPAMNFIREHYDFVILYAYTNNLQDFNDWTSQYFQLIDQLFTKQKKLWITTRIFTGRNEETWEPEAMALEMKNCFDRNMVVLSYHSTIPPLEEVWPLILRGRELYNAKAPYYETSVDGKNLLTGYVGNTYGWVEDSG